MFKHIEVEIPFTPWFYPSLPCQQSESLSGTVLDARVRVNSLEGIEVHFVYRYIDAVSLNSHLTTAKGAFLIRLSVINVCSFLDYPASIF